MMLKKWRCIINKLLTYKMLSIQSIGLVNFCSDSSVQAEIDAQLDKINHVMHGVAEESKCSTSRHN